jgi:hypothetical protein
MKLMAMTTNEATKARAEDLSGVVWIDITTAEFESEIAESGLIPDEPELRTTLPEPRFLLDATEPEVVEETKLKLSWLKPVAVITLVHT